MIFTDFIEMCENVKEFVRNNKDADIEINDDPLRLMLGYKDNISGERWQISLSDVKRSLASLPDDKRDLLRKAFASSEGKENILKSLIGSI